MCNAKFAEQGLDVRLDHRSYERQGVDLLPTIHEGATVRATLYFAELATYGKAVLQCICRFTLQLENTGTTVLAFYGEDLIYRISWEFNGIRKH